MLDYDDPKWAGFQGGYKTPYNPVAALRKLEEGKNVAKVWEEFWQELHHQGDLGDASFAVVPELLRIQKAKGGLGWNFYALLSTIEVERHRKTNPKIPGWLQAPYQKAWQELVELGLSDLRVTKDPVEVQSILAALALAKGALKLGAFVIGCDGSELDEYLDEHMAWSDLYRG